MLFSQIADLWRILKVLNECMLDLKSYILLLSFTKDNDFYDGKNFQINAAFTCYRSDRKYEFPSWKLDMNSLPTHIYNWKTNNLDT